MNPTNDSTEQNTTPETNDVSTNQPKLNDVTAPTPTDMEVDATPEEVETSTPEPVVPKAPKGSSNKKFVVIIVIIILLALAAVAGVYYWQNQQLKDAQAQNDQLTAQMNSAKSAATEAVGDAKDTATTKASEAAAKAVSTDILAGQVDFNQETTDTNHSNVTLVGYAITSNLKSAWIEYGTSVDKLTSKTASTSNEFGMGEAGTYSNVSFDVKKTDLQAGINYYYRVAATDKNGATIHSGIAAFTNLK